MSTEEKEIKKQEEEYSASNIQVLEGLEAVRKRPAMYIGDIGEKGLHHLVYEVVDNSIDEALAGHCTDIDVTINEDNSITVKDNGRGIPTDFHEKEGKSALEVVLTVLHAGGKFDKGSYKVSGGLHGVGVSCVNALSTLLIAEIHRDGKIFRQSYSKGAPTSPVEVIGTCDDRGTTITFKPDGSIFTLTTEYKYDILANRLRELAFLNKGIHLNLLDKRQRDENGEYVGDHFYSEEGLKEFVEYLDATRGQAITESIIYIDTEKNGVPVEVAMQYNDSFSENVHSYVNNINTIEGGTHLTGFRRALTRTLKKYAEDSGMLAKLKFDINGDDFREGLTAVVSVKVAEPQFEGQTKTKLGNDEVSAAVDQAMSTALSHYLEENPRDAKAIVQKVILAATARHAARHAREMVQRKTVLSGERANTALALSKRGMALGLNTTEFVYTAAMYMELNGETPSSERLMELIGEIERGSITGRLLGSGTMAIGSLYRDNASLQRRITRPANTNDSAHRLELGKLYPELYEIDDLDMLYRQIFLLENMGICIFSAFALINRKEALETIASLYGNVIGNAVSVVQLLNYAGECLDNELQMVRSNSAACVKQNIPEFVKVLYRYFGE